ncbi:MAG: ROK family protein [Clostridiales bacterium]|nr:ROK family protein [Clostridiales bacterium]
MEKKYLGIDIGGTFIKYGIVNDSFSEEVGNKIKTKENPEAFLEQVYSIVEWALDICPEILGIGISIGAFVNPVTGTVNDYSVGANLNAYNLKQLIFKKTKLPVSIENDCNCAILAEHAIGAGTGCENLCLTTIGTGIGGAIFLNGRLVHGSSYKAGEFGLSMIGKEKFAGSTKDLVKRVSQIAGKEVDGEYVFSNLDKQDIYKIYEMWIEDLAILFGNVAMILNPEKMLIGGGVSANPLFIRDLRRRMYQLFLLEDSTDIVACQLENNAGKIGAILRLMQDMEIA